MKRKTFYMTIAAITSCVALTCTILFSINKGKNLLSRTNATDPTYSVTLNSSAFAASNLTTSYQTSVVQNFGNDKPVMNYCLAKKDSNNKLVLAPAGKIFNYSTSGTYKGRITNIRSITVTYTGGTLYVQEGLAGGAEIYGNKSSLSSGVEKELTQSPNYLMISNSVAATTITSIVVEYSCNEAGFTVERLGTSYNGMASNGTAYTLTRNGSNVSVAGQTGTISINNTGNFSISLASGTIVYNGTVSTDYKTLTFTSKSGSNAGSAPTLAEMNRIYVVDDFESYSQNGTTFTGNSSHSAAQNLAYVNSSSASDLRGAWYSDYGGGGNNTWVEGSNFSIPSSTDFLNTMTSVKHGGNRSATFKASTGGWMRHWTREIFNQDQHFNYGSGNKLSFWAHGGYTNQNCTTAATQTVEVRAQVYYQNFVISDSNRNSTTYGCGVKTISIAAGSDWTEYTFDIDPSKKVYAVNLMFNNSGLSANQYIPIDDITIYTQPVFEPNKIVTETSTKFTKSYHGDVTVSSIGFKLKIGLGADGSIYAYAGADMEPTSYTISGTQITIVTTGSYSSYTFGTWVGTLSNNNTTITINKNNISGTIKNKISESVITLNEDTILADGSEGSLATLETNIKRQYSSDGSTWTDDPGNSDRFTFNSEYHIEGINSIRVRPHSSYNMRVVPTTSFISSHKPFEAVAFWVYVPAGTSYSMQVFTYKTTSFTNGKSVYAPSFDGTDPGWHYINMGLDTKNSYGQSFAIFITHCSAQTILDYITCF